MNKKIRRIMNYTEYEKYMDEFKAVIDENERRIETKFAGCEKWVAENLIDCGYVYHKHSEFLREQKFMIWIRRGINTHHRVYTLSECGINPLLLLSYPVRI